MNNITDKTLALAAVFQAAKLVQDIATTGVADQHDVQVIISGVFNTNPSNTEAVFGSAENLRTGLKCLSEQLGSATTERDIDITRYVISLLHLQKKLLKDKEMLNFLSRGIERAQQQSEHFSQLHDNVIANLAGVYSESVSTLQPKIMVSGENQYLSHTEHVNKVRALLLGGIRAAVLWSQLGGSRWQILFSRKRFVEQADRMLANTQPPLN